MIDWIDALDAEDVAASGAALDCDGWDVISAADDLDAEEIERYMRAFLEV